MLDILAGVNVVGQRGIGHESAVTEGILLVVTDGYGAVVVVEGMHRQIHGDGAVGSRAGSEDCRTRHRRALSHQSVEDHAVPRQWQRVVADRVIECRVDVPVHEECEVHY